MRKFISKVQDVSKKAAEIKEAVEGMQGKAAELRQAVVMSAAELQQIRSDVQNSMSGLRANSEDGVLKAMRDINDGTATFEEAGYELTGMDLDMAITQRLAVEFRKFEDVSVSTLRHLHSSATNETVKSILSSFIKAEETAGSIELTHLKYDGIILDVGAVPLIRLLWRSDTWVEQQQTIVETTSGADPAPSPAPQASATSAFGSFFEERTVPVSSTTPAPAVTQSHETATAETASAAAPAGTSPATSPATESSSKPASTASALDRFKKMPDLTKSRY